MGKNKKQLTQPTTRKKRSLMNNIENCITSKTYHLGGLFTADLPRL